MWSGACDHGPQSNIPALCPPREPLGHLLILSGPQLTMGKGHDGCSSLWSCCSPDPADICFLMLWLPSHLRGDSAQVQPSLSRRWVQGSCGCRRAKRWDWWFGGTCSWQRGLAPSPELTHWRNPIWLQSPNNRLFKKITQHLVSWSFQDIW